MIGVAQLTHQSAIVHLSVHIPIDKIGRTMSRRRTRDTTTCDTICGLFFCSWAYRDNAFYWRQMTRIYSMRLITNGQEQPKSRKKREKWKMKNYFYLQSTHSVRVNEHTFLIAKAICKQWQYDVCNHHNPCTMCPVNQFRRLCVACVETNKSTMCFTLSLSPSVDKKKNGHSPAIQSENPIVIIGQSKI